MSLSFFIGKGLLLAFWGDYFACKIKISQNKNCFMKTLGCQKFQKKFAVSNSSVALHKGGPYPTNISLYQPVVDTPCGRICSVPSKNNNTAMVIISTI